MVQRRTGTLARPFALVDRETARQANLLAATVEDPAVVNQVYNVAVNAKTTLNELFEMIRSLLEPRYPHLRDLRPLYHEFCPGDVRMSQADISTAERLLAYRPA